MNLLHENTYTKYVNRKKLYVYRIIYKLCIYMYRYLNVFCIIVEQKHVIPFK